MRFVFNFWNFLSKVIDIMMLMYPPYRILRMRKSIRNPKVWFLGFAVIMSLAAYGSDFFFYRVPLWVTVILMLILGLFYTCVFYEGVFYVKAVLISTCVSVCMLVHLISGHFLMARGIELFSPQMTFFPLIFYFPAAVFLIRVTVVGTTRLPSYYGISMSAVMILMMMITGIGVTEEFQALKESVQLGAFLLVLAIILFMYFLFFRMISEYEEKNTYALVARQLSDQDKHLQETRQTYQEMCTLRHELKNHIFYMETLLSKKKFDELSDYFHEIYRKEYNFDIVDTGSDMVNALLNQKISYAKSKGIPISVHVSMPSDVMIPEGKLCAVISNLLDNAIEASEGLGNPSVAFAVHKTGKYLHFVCKNLVSQDISKVNPELKSTKGKANHGIGLQVIQTIVEEYSGMMEHHMEEGRFVMSLMLQIPGDF